MPLPSKKVTLELVGLDGNSYSLMGAFQNRARIEHWTSEEIKQVLDECTSGDRDHLLATLLEVCEPPERDEGDGDEEDYDEDEDDAEELRADPAFQAKLDAAFKAMSDRGLLARQNFSCCQTCAGYELATFAEEVVDRGEVFSGLAFYHQQDFENLAQGEDFYISHGPAHTAKYGTIGKDPAEVAKIVCDCLTGAGIEFRWDGDTGTRILVKVA